MHLLRHLVIFAGSYLFCSSLWACTCAGTTTFLQNMQRAPLVVEGQVTAPPGPVTKGKSVSLLTVTELTVQKVLKGKLAEASITLTDPNMCYASISSRELQAGETYILALYGRPSIEGSIAREVLSPQERQTLDQSFNLSLCAETALLRKGNQVFTFQRAKVSDYKPEPQPYGSYDDLLQQVEAAKTVPPKRPGKPNR